MVRVVTGQFLGPITTGNPAGQAGGGRLRVLLGLAVTLALVYTCWEFISIYGHDSLLNNALQNEAQFARPNHKVEDQTLRELVQKLKGSEITAAPEDIHFKWFDSGMRIWADYTAPVHFPGYQTQLSFHTQGDSRSL
jgi:hypothetical protein